jgi:hypothetical protein
MSTAKEPLTYHIYSHADADGGIAAAIYARHILDNYGAFGWKVQVHPVNHGPSQNDWTLREIQWPCAILDFTLHPALFSERFHGKADAVLPKVENNRDHIPPCAWIDHHPTGSSYAFLKAENLGQFLPGVVSQWDITAISTPGLLRTHRLSLGLSDELILAYEECIDKAEIIDGALYATAQAAHDFDSLTIRLQTLFSSSHPCLDRNGIYKQLVRYLTDSPDLEGLFDSDPIYASLIQFERQLHNKQLSAYESVITRKGRVSVSNFVGAKNYCGMGRFLPYMLMPEVHYAIHVMPKPKGVATITCGINPWNKPEGEEKHLGNYFAKHFGGGGHAFVAGGKLPEGDSGALEKLVEFVNS